MSEPKRSMKSRRFGVAVSHSRLVGVASGMTQPFSSTASSPSFNMSTIGGSARRDSGSSPLAGVSANQIGASPNISASSTHAFGVVMSVQRISPSVASAT
ncbi:MAG: hypothetical protein ACKO8T_04030 [Actinomycetota bacterium]